jgi:membrane-bound lytic murein transglycosylase B
MDDSLRAHSTERAIRHRLPRRALTLAIAVCLLASCSAQDPSDSGTTPDRQDGVTQGAAKEAAQRAAEGSAMSLGDAGAAGDPEPRSSAPAQSPPQLTSEKPAPAKAVESLPAVPASRSKVALARQLDAVHATLRDPDATRKDLQRAGEFQQLAARTLAAKPRAFRRQVTNRLPPPAATLTRNDVQATRVLHAMTTPEESLPADWRIVEPPPPGELLGYYRRAQRRTGVHWTYLAAINLVETRMGRIRGVSSAGAQGPMQFMPSTWDIYGAGGDIHDYPDAILAAARLLKSNGAPQDMSEALWHYNPSDNYVRAVTEHARAMRRSIAAYRGYWHWRVLYSHVRGTYVLPVGYPKKHAELVRER